MAHEALLSLNLMIDSFLNIPKYRNIFLPIFETKSVHKQVWSLKSILELDHFEESERLNALKGEILEAIPKFKDLLQDHINKCLLFFPESQSLYGGGSSNELIFSQDLERAKEEMISFVDTMDKILWKNDKAKLDPETSKKGSPLVDPDEALIIEIESFLRMPYFNNFHLIQETKLVGINIESATYLHRWRSNALKGEILEALPKFRDVLQDYINKCQLLFSKSQSLDDESRSELIFFQDLEKVRKEMISLVETMNRINKEYNAKLDLETSYKESPLVDEDFGGNKALYIRGVNDEDLQQLINRVKTESSEFDNVISVVGMAGIGKTAIVKALYNDPVISDHFDILGFIRVGFDYNLRDILLDLLICFFPNYNKILGIKNDELKRQLDILKNMKSTRYLIVLDDVWDIDLWYDIRRFLPYDNNGSKLIITTRLSSMPVFFRSDYVHQISFLNEEESWNLFYRKVFVEDPCPPGLEKVGKKIVKKCGGLPLGIISIANILLKAEKTLDYWEKVAKDENLLALATEEGSHMSESLFLSYKHLPPHLKECCLIVLF